MSERAYVCSKYIVEYASKAYSVEDFIEYIEQLRSAYGFEWLVEWVNDDHTSWELNKELLEKAVEKNSLDEELKEFCKYLLDTSDKNLDYVKVEVF